jgi:hypothetical protein
MARPGHEASFGGFGFGDDPELAEIDAAIAAGETLPSDARANLAAGAEFGVTPGAAVEPDATLVAFGEYVAGGNPPGYDEAAVMADEVEFGRVSDELGRQS